MQNLECQVDNHFYNKNYDSLPRFVSYYHQINTILKLETNNILEIGVGNKMVSNYLKEMGLNLTTCDFDTNLKPDIVADIRKIPLPDNSFETVMACEVLEHLPWKQLDSALAELFRITNKYVVVSIPYASLCFEFAFKFPNADKIFKNYFANLLIRIPLKVKNKFNGEHYWEMGKIGFPKSKIRKLLSKYFNILEESSPALSSYHYFFVLKKKKP